MRSSLLQRFCLLGRANTFLLLASRELFTFTSKTNGKKSLCIICSGLKNVRKRVWNMLADETRTFKGNVQFPAHKDLICRFCGWKKLHTRSFPFYYFSKIFTVFEKFQQTFQSISGEFSLNLFSRSIQLT